MVDYKREILLHLYNQANVGLCDIKDFLKSLNVPKDELLPILSWLAKDELLVSDGEWRSYFVTIAGVSHPIDNYKFNFRLTPNGRKMVVDEYLHKQAEIKVKNLHIGDNAGNYNQSSNRSKKPINNPINQTTNSNRTSWIERLSWIIAIAGGLIVIYQFFIKK